MRSSFAAPSPRTRRRSSTEVKGAASRASTMRAASAGPMPGRRVSSCAVARLRSIGGDAPAVGPARMIGAGPRGSRAGAPSGASGSPPVACSCSRELPPGCLRCRGLLSGDRSARGAPPPPDGRGASGRRPAHLRRRRPGRGARGADAASRRPCRDAATAPRPAARVRKSIHPAVSRRRRPRGQLPPASGARLHERRFRGQFPRAAPGSCPGATSAARAPARRRRGGPAPPARRTCPRSRRTPRSRRWRSSGC